MGYHKLVLVMAIVLSCGLAVTWPLVVTEGATSGSIEGVVQLQGRDDFTGVEVGLDDWQQTAHCLADGSFRFEGLSLGSQHTIEAAMVGYLTAQRSAIVEAGNPTPLPVVLLLGGDVCTEGSSDSRIDAADLALIGACFNTKPPQHRQADLNDDNIVDIYDLVMAGANFGKTESPWPDGI